LSAEPPKRERVIAIAPTNDANGVTDPNAPVDPNASIEPNAPSGAANSNGPRAATPGAPGTNRGTATTVANGAVANPKGLQCATGKNGGATDTGVTATKIKLGSTVVQSGVGASFLGDVRFAMEAIKDKTNAAGGICGRQIDLVLKDDAWKPDLGAQFIHNLVEDEKVFALAVVPSSEGLKAVSDEGYLKDKKIPTVGTDGMLIHQYQDPYIWPVAVSTISTMHIMVKRASDAGSKQFGLVYENNYRFGIEGAFAFNAAVKRVTNSDIRGYSNPLTGNATCEPNTRFCGINSSSTDYSGEVKKFNDGCSAAPACDFKALLLEPTTALKWIGGVSALGNVGGPQPLFTYDFGNSCGAKCDGMWLWTGYLPPIGDFLARPAVATYVDDMKAASSSADYNNSFVEGGYVGMRLVVEALKQVGPNLTRQNLKQTLDSMTFDSGLSPVLSWSPGNHFANTKMRAFSIQYKSGFAGWRDEQVELEDPWVGQDSGS
jgi:branched-chain amino acid transport system substrate-binding protein